MCRVTLKDGSITKRRTQRRRQLTGPSLVMPLSKGFTPCKDATIFSFSSYSQDLQKMKKLVHNIKDPAMEQKNLFQERNIPLLQATGSMASKYISKFHADLYIYGKGPMVGPSQNEGPTGGDIFLGQGPLFWECPHPWAQGRKAQDKHYNKHGRMQICTWQEQEAPYTLYKGPLTPTRHDVFFKNIGKFLQVCQKAYSIFNYPNGQPGNFFNCWQQVQ